ncbi:MAG: zinc ribbon domain-containing protein [Candidatus Omnitrophota bacterium]
MIKKFLKRFERLENTPKDTFFKEGVKISKRFERLEINERKIEISITDKIIPAEQNTTTTGYLLICPYCGAENNNNAQICSLCNHQLQTKFAKDYQELAQTLKRCTCGAMNLNERKNCWICGRDLFLQDGREPEINADNVISLNIDGREYKSTDKEIPLDIRILMERIRREGYKKEVIDEWAQKKQAESEAKQMSLEHRIGDVQSRYRYRLISLAVGIIVLILSLIFRMGCNM